MSADAERKCEGCGEWHPEYWFDETTEQCLNCEDDAEIVIARSALSTEKG